MKTTILHILIIIIVGLSLSLPTVIYGFPFYSDDGKYHALWYTYFSEQLWQGDVYPRWLSKMNGGLGSPTFFYYPPVPYYLSSIWRPFFTDDPFGWFQLGISSAIAVTSSGLGAYLWLQRIFGQKSALVAAVIYLALPYHAAVDLYARGAFAELWAFVWLPLILYFANRISADHALSALGLGVSFALLLMTHLPTALIFSVIPICYAAFFADARQRIKSLCLVLTALLLGIGLSAIYLIPALTMQEFISMSEMHVGHFDYEKGFLSARSLRDMSFRTVLFGCTTIAVSLACCFSLVGCFSSNNRVKRETIFWTIIVFVSLFMMTPLSKFVWQIFPTLQTIQFPWRFNILIIVATTSLAAASLSALKNFRRPAALTVLSFVGVLLLSCLSITAYCVQENFPALHFVESKTINIVRHLQLKRDAREYRPIWTNELVDDGLKNLLQELITKDGQAIQASIIEGAGEVAVIDWKPRNIILQINSENGVTVRVSQFYFPSWTAQISEENQSLNVAPSVTNGLLSVAVPSGNHQILMQLNKTNQEFIGQIISGISFALLIFCGVTLYYKSFKKSVNLRTSQRALAERH